jgi:predicted lipoprotein with Yx(FWY)xxD motif
MSCLTLSGAGTPTLGQCGLASARSVGTRITVECGHLPDTEPSTHSVRAYRYQQRGGAHSAKGAEVNTTTRVRLLAAIATAAMVALAGCGSSGNSNYGSGGPAATSAAPTSAAATTSSAALKVVQDPKYGSIVVDGRGFAVYRFDKDTASPPASNCSGQCLASWPPVVATGDVRADGVSANLLGTVTRSDGTKQVTLAGWPLYRYQKDSKAGDTTGQAVGNVWWLVKADGSKITMTP